MNQLLSCSRQSLTRKLSSTMGFRKVSHVIFDMDGLLLDTEGLYTEITQKILDPYGKIYTWEVKSELMGLQNEQVSRRIVEIYDLPMTWEEYSKLQRQYAQEMMPYAKLKPDTEPIYEDMTRQIAKSYGKPYPFDVRMRIMGTTEQLTAKIAVTELGLPISVEEFMKKFSELGRVRLADVNLMEGAERLLHHLRDNKVPFALATSSSDEMVEVKTRNHRELFKLFHHQVCGSTDPEVKAGKPAPDIFLVAASRFPSKPKPSDCLVFEDAPNGVRAAKSAGMQSVMVPDEHVPEEMRTDATLVLSSLEEFKPEQFGLPPFPK